MALGPNVVRVRILWRRANAWPPNLVFEKLFFKRKKSLKLKLHVNSAYWRDKNIYFQKKLLSEKRKKISIESISLQKEINTAMFIKLCAAEDLQVCRDVQIFREK